MGFKEVNGADASTSVSLGGINKATGKPNPTTIEGYYVGTKKVPSQRNAAGFSNLYILQTEKGNVGVWGKTDLDKKMAALNPEHRAMCRLSYTGMKKIPGKNDMYTFKVEVDEGNTAPQEDDDSNPNAEFDPEDPTLDESDLDGDDAALDEPTVPYVATAPRTAAPTPDAARQAKVKALLGNKTATARK